MSQAAPGSGLPQINLPEVNWQDLIPKLVGYLFDGIGKYINVNLPTVFNDLWGSSANVVGQTPPPAFDLVQAHILDLQQASVFKAVLLAALMLLGVRGILSGIVPRQPSILGDFVNGVLAAVVLVSAFPLAVAWLIQFTNDAAFAVGTVDLSKYMASVSGGGASNPLIQAVLFVILVFFAVRLLIKAVWRIGFLAVLLPVGFVACMFYAIPQTRWLLGWWVKLWGGMLLAQIPSVLALSIGARLFALGNGLGPFVYSIAFLQLATDLYSVIPFGRIDSSSVPWAAGGARIPGFVSGPVGAAAGMGASVGRAALSTGAAAASVAPTYGYQ